MSNALSGFELLQLKSEKIRAIGMLLVLAVVGCFGIYYLIIPEGRYPQVGLTIILITLVFACFEFIFLMVVQRAIRLCKKIKGGLRDFESFVESVLPVIAMAIIMDVGDNPFIVLVSPAYPLIIIIIAASSLRLNPRLTLYTGLLSTLCYTLLTLRVLYVDSTLHLSPFPNNLYIILAIMLLVTTMIMVFITRQLRLYVNAAVQERILQGELELASEVQKNLLPYPLPDLPGYEIAAFNKPATHTGGDYYDCVQLDAGQLIFMIADVTGHGVGPALMTASSRAYFRAILEQHLDLVEIIQQANRLLNTDLCGGQFVTLAALMPDLRTHRVKFISAGHGSTLLFHNKEGTVEELPAQSIPLGIEVPLKFEQELEFTMQPGDMVVMLSDGCFECKNQEGDRYGLERMIGLIRNNHVYPANDIAAKFQEDVKEFLADQPQSDDMTMLILKRQH